MKPIIKSIRLYDTLNPAYETRNPQNEASSRRFRGASFLSIACIGTIRPTRLYASLTLPHIQILYDEAGLMWLSPNLLQKNILTYKGYRR